jgi:parallel beta-helix repeat protein
MDGKTDRPLANVRFENNVIASGRHGLTLTNCSGCRITGNRLTSAVLGWRSIIRPGQALACGNIVPDGGPGEGKCPG